MAHAFRSAGLQSCHLLPRRYFKGAKLCRSIITPEHGARFFNGALVVFSAGDDGRFTPFIFAAFKVTACVGGGDAAVMRGVNFAGGIIMGALSSVSVVAAVTGVSGAGYAFALTHERRAHIGIIRAVAGESIVSLVAFKPLGGATETLADIVAGAPDIVGARGVLFIPASRGINVFLITAYFVRGGLGHAILIFLFSEVGVELFLKVVVKASLTCAVSFLYYKKSVVSGRKATIAYQ